MSTVPEKDWSIDQWIEHANNCEDERNKALKEIRFLNDHIEILNLRIKQLENK